MAFNLLLPAYPLDGGRCVSRRSVTRRVCVSRPPAPGMSEWLPACRQRACCCCWEVRSGRHWLGRVAAANRGAACDWMAADACHLMMLTCEPVAAHACSPPRRPPQGARRELTALRARATAQHLCGPAAAVRRAGAGGGQGDGGRRGRHRHRDPRLWRGLLEHHHRHRAGPQARCLRQGAWSACQPC